MQFTFEYDIATGFPKINLKKNNKKTLTCTISFGYTREDKAKFFTDQWFLWTTCMKPPIYGQFIFSEVRVKKN